MSDQAAPSVYLRRFDLREEAERVAQSLERHGIAAAVTAESDGSHVVRVLPGHRTIALSHLDGAGGLQVRVRRDWTSPSTNRRMHRLMVRGSLVLLALLWAAAGAPGGRGLFVLVVGAAVGIVGLWLVAPEFFEVRAMRPQVFELLAVGAIVVLAYRTALLVLPTGADRALSYPILLWIGAGVLLMTIIATAGIVLVAPLDKLDTRRVMVLFGTIGLSVALAAAVTDLLHMGYTAERWGLQSVWLSFGRYPVLTIPMLSLTAGVLGWAWHKARAAGEAGGLALAVVTAGVVEGIYELALTHDPFWGLLPVALVGLVWSLAFTRNIRYEPMVPSLSPRSQDG